MAEEIMNIAVNGIDDDDDDVNYEEREEEELLEEDTEELMEDEEDELPELVGVDGEDEIIDQMANGEDLPMGSDEGDIDPDATDTEWLVTFIE